MLHISASSLYVQYYNIITQSGNFYNSIFRNFKKIFSAIYLPHAAGQIDERRRTDRQLPAGDISQSGRECVLTCRIRLTACANQIRSLFIDCESVQEISYTHTPQVYVVTTISSFPSLSTSARTGSACEPLAYPLSVFDPQRTGSVVSARTFPL